LRNLSLALSAKNRDKNTDESFYTMRVQLKLAFDGRRHFMPKHRFYGCANANKERQGNQALKYMNKGQMHQRRLS